MKVPDDVEGAVFLVHPAEEVCKPCNGTGRRKRAQKKDTAIEPKRNTGVKSIRVPKDAGEDGYEVLEGLIDANRDRLADEMGWKPDVPPYFVLVAVLAEGLQ